MPFGLHPIPGFHPATSVIDAADLAMHAFMRTAEGPLERVRRQEAEKKEAKIWDKQGRALSGASCTPRRLGAKLRAAGLKSSNDLFRPGRPDPNFLVIYKGECSEDALRSAAVDVGLSFSPDGIGHSPSNGSGRNSFILRDGSTSVSASIYPLEITRSDLVGSGSSPEVLVARQAYDKFRDGGASCKVSVIPLEVSDTTKSADIIMPLAQRLSGRGARSNIVLASEISMGKTGLLPNKLYVTDPSANGEDDWTGVSAGTSDHAEEAESPPAYSLLDPNPRNPL